MSGWYFLLWSLIGPVLTVNVLWPTGKGTVWSGVSFFIGWIAGEFAPHRLAWEFLLVVFFVGIGALDTWPGQLALGLTLLSWCGALYAYSLSWRAESRVEAALVEALGDNYRDEIVPRLRAGLARGLDWKRIFFPFPSQRPEVDVIRDIRFTRGSGIDVKLDIYRPTPAQQDILGELPGGRPVLLQIHGGGWTLNKGDKRHQALPLMNRLAAQGWICVTADYRLSPQATFPDHIVDVKQAIRWIKQEGDAYGMNTDFIVITGGSAGGHLSSLAALTPNDPSFQPGFEEIDCSVQACVPFYGVYDFIDEQNQNPNSGLKELFESSVIKGSFKEKPKLYESASPVHRVTEGAPPFFVIHGDRDVVVPLWHAHALIEKLRQTSLERVAFAELPGGQHGFEMFSSPRCQFAVAGVERFVNWTYSRYLLNQGVETAKV